MLDFNTEPYNDDFDENNKFYRILFRPSFAVQARELTQMQSILQNQIRRHGDHIFKQGAMVIPGQISVDTNYHYVKLQDFYGSSVTETYVDNLLGQTITGQDSGVQAVVVKVVHTENTDPTTLYLRYVNSGDDTETKTFADGETLSDGVNTPVNALASNATGVGCAATIQRGVFYINGFFVLCDEQSIILDKYTNIPSYRVGLAVDEQKLAPETTYTSKSTGDVVSYDMLLDNAQNSYNYAAPGAHRYYIDLVLTKIPLYSSAQSWLASTAFIAGSLVKSGTLYYLVTAEGVTGNTAPTHTQNSATNGTCTLQYVATYDPALDTTSDSNFIELISTLRGVTQKAVTTTAYSEIEKTLARRTMDESGNYTVKPFRIDIREHRNNDRGQWMATTAYLLGDVVTNNGNSYVVRTAGTSASSGGPSAQEDGITDNTVVWDYTTNPALNRGVYTPEQGGDETKLAIGMEPGKAYVDGYEIEKIVTEYVTVDKARDDAQVVDAYVQAPVGNYVLVTNINSLPPFDQDSGFARVDIYDRFTTSVGSAPSGANLIGTARVKSLTYDSGTTGTQGAVYKMYLFDLKMNTGYDFARNAKSFYFSRTGTDFTADISPIITQLTGSATTYTTYPTKGASATLTGIGTSWFGGTNTPFRSPSVVAGDYIYIGNPTSGGVRRRIDTTVSADNSIHVDSSVTADGSLIYLVTTNTLEAESSKLYFPLPNNGIHSVRSSLNTKQIIYYVTKYISATSSSVVGTAGTPGAYCTLTCPAGSGVFASPDDVDNFIVVLDDSTGQVIKPLVDPAITVGGASSITFKIDCSGTDYSGKSFIVMGTIKKIGSDGGEKTKTIRTETVTFTTAATAGGLTLSLGKADVYRVKSVKMKSGTWGSEGDDYTIDIIDRFTLDNGQRETHYDISKLILKQSYAPPTASVAVTFEYFEHSTGDYFTINSYTDVAYGEIPAFGVYSLRDVIDFRPRIGDAGTVFSGSGSSFSLVPKRGTDITADYTYYMPRKDKIAIDFSGKFFNIRGVASDRPQFPADPALGMVLYGLTLQPYTFGTTQSVLVDAVDNKRYTMRDIGKLEKRIQNLEFYTTLSLAEQDTKQMSVKDANGLERYKNGFIVDSFTGHNLGNTLSPDYLCSIDMQNKELRPAFNVSNVNLVETLSVDDDRTNNGYKLYGDVITLPVIDEPILIKQAYGSRVENVNPFAVFTFLGDMNMNPSSDDWFETKHIQDIVRNVEGNYNITLLANNMATVNTIWNAWQTVWTGTASFSGARLISGSQDVLNYAMNAGMVNGGNFSTNGGWGRYWGSYSAAASFSTPSIQTRTGLKTTLVTTYDEQVIDDKVVSTTVIPYIRARNILIQSKKLKPNTRFYPFFDGVSVNSYCTPSSKITYTLTSTNDFNCTINAGNESNEAARIISYSAQVLNGDKAGNMCLNIGDVITGGTSGATAVVVGVDQNPDTSVRTLNVMNIKGTFSVGEQLLGSISGATGTVLTAEGNKTQDGQLVTNFKGDLNFIFWLPNYDYQKFRCGTREFKLLDVSVSDAVSSSSAKTQYEATGILQTKQRTVNSVRNAKIVQEVISTGPDTRRTVYNTIERIISGSGYYDPLAQTFLVQQKGGAFLSKVDVFFATKDTKLPVTMELREVVNGYPGQRVLPFSKVTLDPSQVKISSTLVQMTDGSGASMPKYDTPTTFRFPSPVFVQENQEYAIILSSDSNNYKLWISQMGDLIPGSSRTISEQPYLGSLFKSQNATTWTAAQDQDLMFTVYRCKFDTSVTGSVEFSNDVLLPDVLQSDPFEVVSGTNKIRVWHTNHGLFANSKVEFDNQDTSVYTGIAGTGTITTSTTSTQVNGNGTYFITEIPSAGTVLYRSSDGKYLGVVDHVENDELLVLRSNCTTTIGTGTAFRYADSLNGIPVTEIYKNANPLSPLTLTVSSVDLDSYVVDVTTSGTATGYCGGTTVTTTGNLVYDLIQPSVQVQNFSDTTCEWRIKTTTGKSVDGGETPYRRSDFVTVSANENNVFTAPQVVASSINQESFISGNAKTLTLQAKIHSDNDALTPVIDTHRTSAIVVSNKINAPTQDNVNVAALDNRTIFAHSDGAFTFQTDGRITSTDTEVRNAMKLVTPGKYITVTGATTSSNNKTVLVTGVTDNGSTGTITTSTTFANESSTTGTSVALRVLFVDEIAPVGGSTINKYVSKVVTLADPATFINIRYAVNCPSEAEVLVYYKTSPIGTTVDFTDNNWTLAAPKYAMPKVKIGDNTFSDMEYAVTAGAAFDKIMVKLVMNSTNSSAVPRIKELRIIACA